MRLRTTRIAEPCLVPFAPVRFRHDFQMTVLGPLPNLARSRKQTHLAVRKRPFNRHGRPLEVRSKGLGRTLVAPRFS